MEPPSLYGHPVLKSIFAPRTVEGRKLLPIDHMLHFVNILCIRQPMKKKSISRYLMGLDGENNLVALSNKLGNSEMFAIVRNQYDPDRVRIRAPNGLFLRVNFLYSFTVKSIFSLQLSLHFLIFSLPPHALIHSVH
ncbi:hypothetical protein CFOL_v3_33646 [Cephalotus follicularis]|uniref:DUF7910 domain-containing protein n=1 Tax=Cephalotus follicularis TaxID=3775 RepID=A0A1Q3DCM6_CEPFO|nr:hypothetical protein CFOL_v3_33646 [Cephalotus follicularis]